MVRVSARVPCGRGAAASRPAGRSALPPTRPSPLSLPPDLLRSPSNPPPPFQTDSDDPSRCQQRQHAAWKGYQTLSTLPPIRPSPRQTFSPRPPASHAPLFCPPFRPSIRFPLGERDSDYPSRSADAETTFLTFPLFLPPLQSRLPLPSPRSPLPLPLPSPAALLCTSSLPSPATPPVPPP